MAISINTLTPTSLSFSFQCMLFLFNTSIAPIIIIFSLFFFNSCTKICVFFLFFVFKFLLVTALFDTDFIYFYPFFSYFQCGIFFSTTFCPFLQLFFPNFCIWKSNFLSFAKFNSIKAARNKDWILEKFKKFTINIKLLFFFFFFTLYFFFLSLYFSFLKLIIRFMLKFMWIPIWNLR